jgi:hypothetical protein
VVTNVEVRTLLREEPPTVLGKDEENTTKEGWSVAGSNHLAIGAIHS